jgi:hypothetical protein
MSEKAGSLSAVAVDAVLWRHGAIQGRDAVAVGIASRVVELGCDTSFEFF